VSGPGTSRFHLPMAEWLAFGWRALDEMHGGEIFLPKCRAWVLDDLATAFDNPAGVNRQARRPADKQDELLYSLEESYRVQDIGWAFVIEPPEEVCAVWNYRPWGGANVAGGVPYSSGQAERVGLGELRQLVSEL
jgi:UDP-N-acetylglucosamine 4,6-dehydratase